MKASDFEFDVAVVGTGLSESIVAAALSKAGFKVLHLDPNDYYGSDQASMSLTEIINWADGHKSQPEDRYRSISQSLLSTGLTRHSREYSITLSPSMIPSTGPLITTLIQSGVARYGGFRLLQSVAMYDQNSASAVPSSKEDVFKSKDMTLLEKRKLMRFLLFASGDFEGASELEGSEEEPFLTFIQLPPFSLPEKIAQAVTYAVAQCPSASEQTLPALKRTRQFLRSSGRYGNSPFLVGHYGGIGELSQGFCRNLHRTCAVNGGTYILGRKIRSIARRPTDRNTPPSRLEIRLDQFEEPFNVSLLIAPLSGIPSDLYSKSISSIVSIARCIAILSQPIPFAPSTPPGHAESSPEPLDTSLLVFPPGSLPNGSASTSVTALITGEGSMSCPRGEYITYISLPIHKEEPHSAEELLTPYLDAVVSLTTEPSTALGYKLFFIQDIISPLSSAHESLPILFIPAAKQSLAEIGDSATDAAELIFKEVVDALRPNTEKDPATLTLPFWPPLEAEDEETTDW